MFKSFNKSTVATLGVGLAMGLLVGIGMMIGTAVALKGTGGPSAGAIQIPERLLRADSAASGKQMALATGEVWEGGDGIFILDFLTGDLYCWVPNPKNMKTYMAVYKTNVIDALGVEKGKTPDYVLTTGTISVSGGHGAGPGPAGCVCYVADGNTGRVASYGLLFDSQLAKRGGNWEGALELLVAAPARPEVEQEQQ